MNKASRPVGLLALLAPQVGLEPTTLRLTVLGSIFPMQKMCPLPQVSLEIMDTFKFIEVLSVHCFHIVQLNLHLLLSQQIFFF